MRFVTYVVLKYAENIKNEISNSLHITFNSSNHRWMAIIYCVLRIHVFVYFDFSN